MHTSSSSNSSSWKTNLLRQIQGWLNIKETFSSIFTWKAVQQTFKLIEKNIALDTTKVVIFNINSDLRYVIHIFTGMAIKNAIISSHYLKSQTVLLKLLLLKLFIMLQFTHFSLISKIHSESIQANLNLYMPNCYY